MRGGRIFPDSFEKNISAIILAAGYSSRMNDFKPLMPLGNSTVVECAINIFKNAGVQDIIVVTGYRADNLIKALDRLDISYVYNENFNQGMFSSILKGVKSLRAGCDGFLLLPADMPLVKTETIIALIEKFKESKYDIVYPVYKGVRGHPPLISSSLFRSILGYEGTGGLRALLAKYQDKALDLELEDAGVIADIDTREDYSRWLEFYSHLN